MEPPSAPTLRASAYWAEANLSDCPCTSDSTVLGPSFSFFDFPTNTEWLCGCIGAYWDNLPCRLKHLVLSRLSMPTVNLLGMTSCSNFKLSRTHARHRICVILSPFHLDFIRTMSILRKADALISGSATINVLAPVEDHFEPNDLDIYVPVSSALVIHDYLIKETPYIPADSLEECGFPPIPSLMSNAGPQVIYPGVTRGLCTLFILVRWISN